jgi:hypothetical protein
VKRFIRVFGTALFGLAVLTMNGCATDNETEADAAKKTAGDPGAPNPKAVTTTPKDEPPPQTQAEYYQRRGDPYKAMPGAERKAPKKQ